MAGGRSHSGGSLLFAAAAVTAMLDSLGIQAKLDAVIAPPGGQCGPEVGAVCPKPQCCSQYGFCGVTPGHCGGACQPEWGNMCNLSGTSAADGPTSTTSPATKPSTQSSPAKNITASRDQSLAAGAATAAKGGKCGPEINTVCPAVQCCSTSGWCGRSKDHCLANGCQPAWGACGPEHVQEFNVTLGELKSRPDKNTKAAAPWDRCGAVVDSMCISQCCSNEGYCGTTPEYCDVGKCVESWGSCPGKPAPWPPQEFDDSAGKTLDTRTIIGIVSGVVVGVCALVGLTYTGWKWWHKHRAVKAIKKQGTSSSTLPCPPPTGVVRSLMQHKARIAAAVKIQKASSVQATTSNAVVPV